MYSGDLGDKDKKICFLKYLLHALFSFLDEFNHDQMVEKDMEANIRGNPILFCMCQLNFF